MAPEQLYLDHTSGAKSSRPAWDALCKALRAGDVLVATRLDRVGRSTSHLVTLLDELAARGVAFRFLEQGIDTTTSEGRLMYRMLAAIAVISSSSADQAPDLVLRVEDGVFDTAA